MRNLPLELQEIERRVRATSCNLTDLFSHAGITRQAWYLWTSGQRTPLLSSYDSIQDTVNKMEAGGWSETRTPHHHV